MLALAKAFRRKRGIFAKADYRHLEEFRDFQVQDRLPEGLKAYFEDRRPYSFFLSPIDTYNEEALVSISKHLNFYMSYFARFSPIIDIHETAAQADVAPAVVEFDVDHIPGIISARELDPFLLDYNLAAFKGEPRLRFVYYYQIVEYAAFYWMEESVKANVARILRSPDLHVRLEEYLPKVIEALVPKQQDKDDKLRKVLELKVNARDLWAEMSPHAAYFAADQVFDGGFCVKALISKGTTVDAFETMSCSELFMRIRNIRNALVHGREKRNEFSILPTAANDVRLAPWIPVMRRIAEQVTINES